MLFVCLYAAIDGAAWVHSLQLVVEFSRTILLAILVRVFKVLRINVQDSVLAGALDSYENPALAML